MLLSNARTKAEALVEQMRPFCERLEIAGSIRRKKPEVKDIEIVAIPKLEIANVEDESLDLFGNSLQLTESINKLHLWATKMSGIRWIKTGTPDIVDWQPKPEGKYWRGLVDDEIKLDLFLARPENFGVIFVIRTGSAQFTTALVTYARRMGMPVQDGMLTRGGQSLETFEERDVFRILKLDYVEPPQRVGWKSIRRSSQAIYR
jgi:DNA polymerase/3'-5' exonuclease PolX